ncbi:metallophosphoesterase [Geopseudomonas aromaticivorans]
MAIPYLDLAPSGLFATFARNEVGRDLLVGDIHGHASLLHHLLAKAGFNQRVDRLFATGDLGDRGPQSPAVLALLDEPWFHSVRGNHDQMCVDGANGYSTEQHVIHGGGWFYQLESRQRQRISERIQQLPIAFEIEGRNQQRYGLVHAECPLPDWQTFREVLSAPLERSRDNTDALLERMTVIDNALWNKPALDRQDIAPVMGIDQIYVGHSRVRTIRTLGNTTYIDTGIGFENGSLSLVDLHTQATWSAQLHELS